MLKAIAKKIVGSRNERYLKKLRPLVEAINAFEPQVKALDQEAMQARIAELRQEVAGGRTLDDILPETFALVREASVRALGMRHFDVQLVGGITLHQGKIAEMKTGEGKTLVATLPIVLNALDGKGAHLITVNDYLAKRDAAWMGKLYNYLGLTVGVIVHGLEDEERQANYAADITYGTNNEFGFDYLRDNMKFYKEQLVQRPLHYAIVDEVDSILIDEARTPLIISGMSEDSSTLYARINAFIPLLRKETDFTIDEKARTVLLTDDGVMRMEEVLKIDNLYDPANITLQHHVLQALKAHHIFQRDVDYVVKDGQVIIVDEFTGRLMPGRRYSDGLHQALEAKEGVDVESENQTLATITFQNYFRMYDKLSGMTGTADTEAVEFREIYDLEVISIPTHRPMVRKDFPDLVYKTHKEKFAAITADVKELHQKGQPVLVGTVSIEKSELLSSLLQKAGVPHDVLNAKNHEKEAEIVAQAGQAGRVTIATNMAGRGTDIVLGPGVTDLGGLHILGTERHESRRIDNQLRGRSGRQGDPGSSRFYLALDDDLMRLFGSDRLKGLMDKLGMEDGEPIENRMVSRAIENAQKRVEAHNFEIRKQLLEYDNVMNQQREVIYSRRRELMETTEPEAFVQEAIREIVDEIFGQLDRSKGEPEPESLEVAKAQIEDLLDLRPELTSGSAEEKEAVLAAALGRQEALAASAGDHYREIARYFLLDALDRYWKEHLLAMDALRDGIGLRGYGQKDPKQEYKKEGFLLFQQLIYGIRDAAVRALSRVQLRSEVREQEFHHKDETANLQYSGSSETAEAKPEPKRRAAPKVGRNDPCPCGSGKKYKKCCGNK
ncbi:MAG: preprotein translocase subunit SecA [Desulfovibrionaceae bacterium]